MAASKPSQRRILEIKQTQVSYKLRETNYLYKLHIHIRTYLTLLMSHERLIWSIMQSVQIATIIVSRLRDFKRNAWQVDLPSNFWQKKKKILLLNSACWSIKPWLISLICIIKSVKYTIYPQIGMPIQGLDDETKIDLLQKLVEQKITLREFGEMAKTTKKKKTSGRSFYAIHRLWFVGRTAKKVSTIQHWGETGSV